MRLPTLLLLVASALLLVTAGAQPAIPCNTYGDCSCQTYPPPFGVNGVNCTGGTWFVNRDFNATGNIVITTDRVDINGSFNMPNGYNFTFTAVFNSSTPSGGYVHATRVNFGATNYIFWSADAPRIGNYTYVLMEVDDYSGSSMPKNFVTPTVVQAVCRAVQFTVGPSRFTFHASFEAALAAHVCCGYSDSANLPVVRFNATVSSTGQACPGSLPSNDWVLIVLYVVAGVLGAMILFILLTCFVRPLKKKVWYPPKDV